MVAASPALPPWVRTISSDMVGRPYLAVVYLARACCSSGEPAIGAYRVRPEVKAFTAASTMAVGVPASGSPMAREMAPGLPAPRVLGRRLLLMMRSTAVEPV